ncbi:MAG: sugar kinase [Deltaproteobacteria bacterium]|nr:sugar kinase [Deltaproteobacteria bacterium]
MYLICGTVPKKDLPLTLGVVKFLGPVISLDGVEIPCTQGTAALISAACVTAGYLRLSPPRALLVGDDGTGKGSRVLYDYLIKNISAMSPGVLLLHYMLPVMGLMKKVCESASKTKKRLFMIADAAAMYAAKAAGLAASFDVFTPDLSEMAFLADPDAMHPAYVSRHLFESDASKIPELVAAAYRHKNAAKMLMVKGSTDYIAADGKIVGTISEPDVPALEAIGGTGDTISGMAGAFICGGFRPLDAARATFRANRMAGQYAGATPATRIREIIEALPRVFDEHLEEWKKAENSS